MPSLSKSSKKSKSTPSGAFSLTLSSRAAHKVPSASSLRVDHGKGKGGGHGPNIGALPRYPISNPHTSFPSPPPSPEQPTSSRSARHAVPLRPPHPSASSHSQSLTPVGHAATGTVSSGTDDIVAPPPPPKFVFLPTYIPHRTGSDNSVDSFKYSADNVKAAAGVGGAGGGTGEEAKYGFLGGIGKGVVLGLEEVKEVVVDVSAELESRGLTTPLLFSTQALEANQSRTALLIQAYLDSLSHKGNSSPVSKSAHSSFKDDLRYAKEFELAWLLRWALSRVTRRAEETKEVLRGLIEWDAYEEWRGRERSANYPLDAFPYLSALIPSQAYSVIKPLMHLLSRFVAHSHLSGLTPHTLSGLFAPLLFHIPCGAPALVAHAAYVRTANATEHLLLAYIRSTSSSLAAQHASPTSLSSAREEIRSLHLGISDLPPRLKEWVTHYPRMVASDADLARGHARAGAKVVACERASRVVRAYSRDLVSAAESWASEPDAVGEDWLAWRRVLGTDTGRATSSFGVGGGGRPKFSAAYKLRTRVKETQAPVREAAGRVAYGTSVFNGNGQSRQRGGGKGGEGREVKRDEEQEGRWRSVAGREWSMFEEGGFGCEVGERLGFDLTESAKMTVTQKRTTMTWTDFAAPSGGFTRTDPGLSSTLTHFSPPITSIIAQWPAQRTEMHKRLEGSQKDMVPFQWDIRPRFGRYAGEGAGGEGLGNDASAAAGMGKDSTVQVELAFIDFWADLGMGAGWIDRGERTFREANWVFYKAIPKSGQLGQPMEDPRTDELCFLFEERVPAEYQYAIANPAQKRTFNLFSRKKRPPMPPTSSSNSITRLQGLSSSLRSPTSSAPLGLGGLTLGLGKTISRSSANNSAINSTANSPERKGPSHASGLTYDSHGKEAEFDRMLMSDAHTKRIQVNKGKEEATIWHKSIDPPLAPLPLKSLSTATSPVQAARAAAAAPAPVASPTQAHAQPTFKVVSRDRAMSVGQTEPARQGQVHQAVQGGAERRDRSNQASEEEDEIRTPDMSRDDGFGTPVVVGTNAGHASMLSKLSPIAPHTKQNPVPLPGYGGLNAHTALQQMSLSPSSVSDDPYSLTKPAKAKPLPVAPHASPPRRIQPPALTEYEIRAQAESGSDRAEVLAPSPRPPSRDSAGMLEAGIEANNVLAEHGGGERDTIHGIVEGYSEAESMRDGRYRGVDDVDEVGVEHEEEGYDYDDEEALGSASTGYQHPHLRIISDEERERIKFRPVSDVEGEDGEFRPPGPLFDVAPTREPSPGRYQHGLPLHHVTEEEEEYARYR